MSKAEDLSKQYRDYREQCGIKDPVMLDEIEEAYFKGYHQGEKNIKEKWNEYNQVLAEEYEKEDEQMTQDFLEMEADY